MCWKDRCDECDRKHKRAKDAYRKKKAVVRERSQEARFCIDCFTPMDPMTHKAKKRCPACVEAEILAGRYSREKNRLRKRVTRSNRDDAKKLWHSVRNRAATKGVHFTLALEDIVVPDECPVLKKPIIPASIGGVNPMMPSVDRHIPEKGYTKDNIVIMSHRANSLKSNATFEEIEALYLYLRSKREDFSDI